MASEGDGRSAGSAPDPRRRLLVLGVGGLSLGIGAVAAVPGVAFLTYPLSHATTSGSEAFLPAGKADSFVEGRPVKVELFSDRVDAWNRVERVKVGSAWVVREGAALHAYSTVCPHLGCAVDWDHASDRFKCPCHRSSFSRTGDVQEGPSPRPLDRLDVEVVNGLLAVRYQRFRQGVTEKVRA